MAKTVRLGQRLCNFVLVNVFRRWTACLGRRAQQPVDSMDVPGHMCSYGCGNAWGFDGLLTGLEGLSVHRQCVLGLSLFAQLEQGKLAYVCAWVWTKASQPMHM